MSDESPIDIVIGKLEGVKPSGDSGRQWSACCPAHPDAMQSLGVAVGRDDTVLLKCYAGCDTKDIVAAMELELKDLFPAKERPRGKVPAAPVTVGSLAFDKRIPVDSLRAFGLTDDASGTDRKVLIPYKDESGAVIFTRERSALKAKDGSKQPAGKKLRPYGLWRLPDCRPGGVLFLVEGESDAWTLWHHEYPALGLPGADSAKSLQAADLDGFDTVYVWRDGKTKAADTSGEHFVARVAARVAELRPTARVLVVAAGEAKDPNEIRQRLGDGFKKRFDEIVATAKPPEPPSATPVPGRFAFTDYGNAQRLVAQHGKDLRHIPGLGGWYAWDGGRWDADGTGEVVRRAKNTVRAIYGEATKDDSSAIREQIARHAIASESARKIAAMVELARSEPEIALGSDRMDADPWLLNCPNGTVDLRTGELRAHRREDMLSKLCPVPYDAAAKCPTWLKTLALIFPNDANNPAAGGDETLIGYVRRLFGLCLTGVVENILPIFWGGGANGKSTILNTVRAVMGGAYAMQAPPNFLMVKNHEGHPTELADLHGRRLVIATETKQNRRIDESLIKQLTGGERVRARRMRQDFFEFDPTHKMILCTNHRPRVSESDEGIWRRLALIPFTVRFWNPDRKGKDAGLPVGPEHLKQDKRLADKLVAEYPGVLAWMVAGCLEWQIVGLGTPSAVERQTEEYRADEDVIGQFIGERVELGNTGYAEFKTVYATYRSWCEVNDERYLSSRQFGAELRRRGHRVDRGSGNRMLCFGFRLTEQDKSVDLSAFDD